MAATVTPLPIKKSHSATRFSIDDILHRNDKHDDFCITSAKKYHLDLKPNRDNNDNNNNDKDDSLAAIDFRERLMKNMLSFEKLTDRKYSSFTEPPIINQGVKTSNIIHGKTEDIQEDLLLKERQRFYEELALKLKIPSRITTTTTSAVNDNEQHLKGGSSPTMEPEKLSLFEHYKISANTPENQSLTPPLTPMKFGGFDTLNYRSGSNSTTASTHLSTIAARGSINDTDHIDSLGEYRTRHFAPSPHRPLPALPLPPFPTSPSSTSHHRRFMIRSSSAADIYSGSSTKYLPSHHQRELGSHPYYYMPTGHHRYRYEYRHHHSDPYDLHLSKCSYDITTRQYSANNKTSLSNFQECSPTSSTISPTLGNSPTRSPNESPSNSSRQCKGISDSGNFTIFMEI